MVMLLVVLLRNNRCFVSLRDLLSLLLFAFDVTIVVVGSVRFVSMMVVADLAKEPSKNMQLSLELYFLGTSSILHYQPAHVWILFWLWWCWQEKYLLLILEFWWWRLFPRNTFCILWWVL